MARSPRFPGRWVAAVLITAVACLPPARSKGTDEPYEGARAPAVARPAPGEETPLESLIARATKGDIRAQMDLAYRHRDEAGLRRGRALGPPRRRPRRPGGARFHRLDVLRGAWG